MKIEFFNILLKNWNFIKIFKIFDTFIYSFMFIFYI